MRSTFINNRLQNELETNGFVTLSLLTNDEINTLTDGYYQTYDPNLTQPFYTTHWSQDRAHRQEVDQLVRPVLAKKLLGHLNAYKACLGFYLVKQPGEDGEFHVHQDWTLVDEKYFRGITTWVALSDTSPENGCLYVVPGSHQFTQNLRGMDIQSPYSNIKGMIEQEYCEPVVLKAGEAVMFDHRLLHYSPPNKTDNVRLAAGLVTIPQETTFIHYHCGEDNIVAKYIANDDFLLDVGLGQLANQDYKIEKKMVYEPDVFDEKSFRTVYEKQQITSASASFSE